MARVLRRSGVVVAVVVGLAAGACTSSDEPEALAMLSVVDTRIVAQGAGSDEVVEAVDGHAVDVGDRLETNETGYGELDYVDGSQTRLGPETTFTVLELAEGAATTVRSRLDLGRTWNSVQELGAQDRFEIETSVAVASVRGTLFAVVCSDLGCDFVVLEGTVIVTLPDGTEIELNAGDAVHVGPDGVVGDVLEVDRFLLLPSELRGGGGGSAAGGGGTGTGAGASDGDDPDAGSGGGVEVLGSAAGGGDEAFARTTIAWIGRNLERDTSTSRLDRLDDEVLVRLLRAGVERRILEPLSSTGRLPDDPSDGGATGGGTTGGDTDGGATDGGEEPAAGTTGGNAGGTAGGSTGGTAGGTTGGTTGGITGVLVTTNIPPTALPDAATVSSGGTVVVDVLANDVDADGDGLTLTSATASVGSAVANVDGTVTYTAPAGFIGVAVVTYTVRDARGATASGTVSVTVTPVVARNTAPVAVPDAARATTATPVVIDVLANDTDADGDALSAVPGTPSNGTVSVSPDGRLTYTSGAGFVGTATFVYTVSDGRGGSAVASVTVLVTAPPNVAPVALPDAAATTTGTPLSIAVLANDTDADGDTLTVTGVSGVSSGTATVGAGGAVTYSPGPFTGVATFTYTVSDGRGGSASALVTVTVAPAPNTPPVAVADAATTVSATPVNILVLANDADGDGDPLTVSVGTPSNGTAVVNTNQTVTYTSTAGFVGVATFTYTISDGQGGTSSATVAVTVTAPNTAPVAVNDAGTVVAGGAVVIDVLANDSDADSHALTVDAISVPTAGTAVLSGLGTVTYTAPLAFTGPATFTYTVSDGNGGSDTATVTVTVSAANLAPVTVADTAWTLAEATVTVDVLDNDSDPDADPLALSTVSVATNGTTSIVGGAVEYIPDDGFSGTEVLTYTISDGALNAVGALTISVEPVASLPGIGFSTNGVPVGYFNTLSSTDPGPDIVAMAADGSGAVKWTDYVGINDTISGGAGSLRWSPDGTRFAYSADREIRVIDTTAATLPFTTAGEYPAWTQITSSLDTADVADWSPDGTMLAFNFHDGTDWETYWAPADGSGTPTPVTALDASDEGPLAWSPDGQRIAVVSGSGLGPKPTLLEVAAPGNTLGQPVGTVLATYVHPTGTLTSPSYTPDGASILYISGDDLGVLERGTGTFQTLVADGSTNRSPRVSPDGRWLLYTARSVGGLDEDIVVVPYAANATADRTFITSDAGLAREFGPDWRPPSTNGVPVAVADSVYMLENSTLYVDVLANDSDPDNDPLSFTAGTTPAGAASVSTTPELAGPVLAFTPTGGFTGVAVVPYTLSDGNGGTATGSVSVEVVDRSTMGQLAFSSRPSAQWELRLVGLDGSGLTTITNNTLTTTGSMTDSDWAPSGDRLLARHAQSGQPAIIAVPGLNAVTNLSISGGADLARWNAAGTDFAFRRYFFPGSTTHQIWTSNLDATVLTAITTSGFTGGLDWSPDGTRFAVNRSGQLREIDTSGTEVATHTASGAQSFSYAPAGGRIAYVWSGGQQLRVVDTATSAIHEVYAGDGSTIRDTTWSPDGRWIAFTMDATSSVSDIWVAAVQPGAVNVAFAIDTGFADEWPAWRP